MELLLVTLSVGIGVLVTLILQQKHVNRLEDRVLDAEAFLRKMQQEHHDLRRQFLQLEIDFIVLQERSK
jgi:hypothetical protein